MRLHALLILPFVVLHARAASIPDHIVPELEKKLSEAVKEVLDKDAVALKEDLNDPELLDQVNAVENGPSDAPASEDESSDIKRVEIDLKNPGPPQVQRHDFQNPEVFDEAKLKESSVSHSIAETQNVLHEGLLEINEKAHQPALDDEKITLVRNSINELQENFSNQLRVLTDVINKYSNPEASNRFKTAAGSSESASTSDLKKIENDFTTGIENLSEGVAHLKADGDNTASTTAPPNNNNIVNSIWEQIQKLQTTVQNGISNLGAAFQNAFNGTQSNGSGTNFFQQAINNLIPPAQQQQQQPSVQNWFQGITNTVQGWFRPGQAQTTTTTTTTTTTPERPASTSPATGTDAEEATVPQKSANLTPTSEPMEQSGSVVKVEAAQTAEGPTEKGHIGGHGSEYSDNSNLVKLAGDVANIENINDVTEQPEMAQEQNDKELSTNNEEKLLDEATVEVTTRIEKPMDEEILEVTTKVEELQKIEEPVTETEPMILVRSKEQNDQTEEVKTEASITELPSVKEEVTTTLTELMLNDSPKVEDRISTDTLVAEDYKSETTLLPVKEIELELSTEEISTEGIKDIMMSDGLLVENTPIKEIKESDVSGTEVPEIEAITEKEESMTIAETMKSEETITTLNPIVEIVYRNQESPVTEVEINKIVEEEGRTTEGSLLEEQDHNLEVLPKEEIKVDEIEKEITTEVPKAEDNKEEKIRRRVIRRLIKRTLL